MGCIIIKSFCLADELVVSSKLPKKFLSNLHRIMIIQSYQPVKVTMLHPTIYNGCHPYLNGCGLRGLTGFQTHQLHRNSIAVPIAVLFCLFIFLPIQAISIPRYWTHQSRGKQFLVGPGPPTRNLFLCRKSWGHWSDKALWDTCTVHTRSRGNMFWHLQRCLHVASNTSNEPRSPLTFIRPPRSPTRESRSSERHFVGNRVLMGQMARLKIHVFVTCVFVGFLWRIIWCNQSHVTTQTTSELSEGNTWHTHTFVGREWCSDKPCMRGGDGGKRSISGPAHVVMLLDPSWGEVWHEVYF